MERIKVSQNFYLDEFVPKTIYMKYYEKSVMFLDPRLIKLVQFFRDYFQSSITVNDWYIGGKLERSGYRIPEETVGAHYSQHKFGRAADLHFGSKIDHEKIREEIRNNYSKFRVEGLTTIESNTPTWNHIDIRDTSFLNSEKLYEVPFQ